MQSIIYDGFTIISQQIAHNCYIYPFNMWNCTFIIWTRWVKRYQNQTYLGRCLIMVHNSWQHATNRLIVNWWSTWWQFTPSAGWEFCSSEPINESDGWEALEVLCWSKFWKSAAGICNIWPTCHTSIENRVCFLEIVASTSTHMRMAEPGSGTPATVLHLKLT
jgi:hypothetical protein